jgi:allantoate deiminase
VRLPFALEVVGFSEEEGVRFSSGYIGSKGYAGLLSAADLALCDVSGATLREVLGRRAGRRFAPPRAAHARGGLLGYLEVHIEQGPVLEAGKLPLGVVTGIAGQTRGRITLVGRAGHAGTTPMALRRDALAGAAELILFAEALARRGPPLVATVGSLSVAPGAPNVIPGEVVLSLEVRHPRDPARRAGLRRLLAQARRIARRRGLRCSWHATQDNGAVACSRRLTSLLEKGVRSVQGRSLRLASGAGHDAVVMASAAPVAMLFVRCRGGVSHHPSEHAARADLGAALAATLEFLDRLAGGGGRP